MIATPRHPALGQLTGVLVDARPGLLTRRNGADRSGWRMLAAVLEFEDEMPENAFASSLISAMSPLSASTYGRMLWERREANFWWTGALLNCIAMRVKQNVWNRSWLAMWSEEASVAAERHSHLAEEAPGLIRVTGTGHDGDSITADGVDLVVGDFGKDDLFAPEGVMPRRSKFWG